MPISSRVLATLGADETGNFSVPLDQDAVEGEFLTASVFTSYSANGKDVTMPGWTLLGSALTAGDAFSPNGYLFFKTASAAEPSAYDVNTNVTTADNMNVVIAAHTEVDLADPFAADPVWDTSGQGSGTAPSVTPDGAPSRAFWAAANQAFTSPPTQDFDWTGATQLVDSLSVWCFAGWAYQDRTDTTATGTRAWTIPSYGGNTPARTVAFALREATVPTGPEYTDRLNENFTAASQSSTYHIYAQDVDPGVDNGLVMYFHGDGGYEFDQENDFPSDFYAIPGPLGVAEQGRSRNMITVVPRTPDADDTWWTDGANTADYAKALYDFIVTEYGIDTTNVWLVGYSGGAQLITQFLLPEYPAMCSGGAAVMFGGGGEPVTTPGAFSSGLKADFPMVWVTGDQDLAANSPGEGYDGYLESQYGATWYETEGFTVYREFPVNVDHTDLEYRFGPTLGYYMERISWGTVAPTTEYTFDSAAETTSGDWIRVTGTPTPYQGAGALQSLNPNQPGTSDATLAVPEGALGMRFRYRVNTEEYGDLFWVAVDGDFQPMGSGQSPYGWSESAPYDVSGAQDVTFRFVRDSSGGQGSANGDPGNRVTVDSVIFEFPYSGPEPVEVSVVEDFEDDVYNISFTGDWARSTTQAHGGSYSLKAATITHNEESAIVITLPDNAQTIQFWWKVSSENNYDYFAFGIDENDELFARSGDQGWSQSIVYDVTTAETVTFRYYKDTAASGGSDTAWIDDIELIVLEYPATGTEPGRMLLANIGM